MDDPISIAKDNTAEIIVLVFFILIPFLSRFIAESDVKAETELLKKFSLNLKE